MIDQDALAVDRRNSHSKRMRSLDGLRGLAAVAVVLGHARLITLENNPSNFYDLPVFRDAARLLGITGAHAVWLFFILSGLVLTRMMVGSKNFDYGNYLLGRIARLYIPVTAAVVFTFGTMLFVSRDMGGFGHWVDNHPNTYSPSSILYDLTLIGGSSGNLSPLWSLRWEVLFSLLLVLYTAVIRKVPPLLAVAIAIALCAVGQGVNSPVLMFMSMFAIGTALAFAWDRLIATRDAIEMRLSRYMWLYTVGVVVAIAATVVLQLLPSLLAPLSLSTRITGVANVGASMLGLTGCIVLVGLATPLRVIFETRFMQWLGVISLSLYLVHEPILLAFVYLFDAAPLAVAIGMALCFPVAHLFYWAIEKPSHRLARRISHRTARLITLETATPR